jgi:RNA polymerase sigma-70 factor (ECF subfamily)
LFVQRLFEQHHEELYRYLVRLTGDSDTAADIAQETFIRWVENDPREAQPRAWLFKVATNLARDGLRVQSRRLTLLEESPGDAPLGDAPLLPDQDLERSENQRLVRDALAALPERDKMILLMREEGFSHREIADAAGTTTKSVGTLLARALRALTAQLAPDSETLL